MRHTRSQILAFVCALLLTAAARPAEPTGLGNLDFESGKDGWGVWYSDDPKYQGPRFEWAIDKETFRSGKASMRIVADDRKGRAFVHQSTRQFTRGARHELSYWIKLGSPEMYEHCAVTVNMVRAKPGGKERDLVQVNPVTFYEHGDNGWLHRRGFFIVDKDIDELQIGLSVKNTLGTVWFDDIRLTVVPPGEIRVESMYDYTPGRVDLGPDMVKRFEELRAKRPGVLDRAKVYNRLLVESAQLVDNMQRLARVAFYLEGHGKNVSVAAERDTVVEVEKQLDRLYQTDGKAFKEGKTDSLDAFDHAAKVVELSMARERERIAEKTQRLRQIAKDLGLTWTPSPPRVERETAIAPDGKPNQLIFGTVSL